MVNGVQETSQMDNTISQVPGLDRFSSSSGTAHSSQDLEVKTNMSMQQAIASLVEYPERRSRFIEVARRLCKGSPDKFDRMASDDAYFRNVTGALIKQSGFHGNRMWSRLVTTISSSCLDGQEWKRCLDELVKEYVASCSRKTVLEGASFSSGDLQSSAASSGHTIANQIGSPDHVGGDAGAAFTEPLILNNVDSSNKSPLINPDQTDGGAVNETITANAPVSSKAPDSLMEVFEKSFARQTSSPPLSSDRQRFDPNRLDTIMLQPPSPEEELPRLTPPRRRARVGAWRDHVKATRADIKNPPVLTRAPESPSENSKNSSERTTSSPPPLIAYHQWDADKLDDTMVRPLSPDEELLLVTSPQKRFKKEALKNGTKVSSDSTFTSSCTEKTPGCLEKVMSDARRNGCIGNAGDSSKGRKKQKEQKLSGRDGDSGDQNYSQNEGRRLWKSQDLQPPEVLKSGRASGSQKIRKPLTKLSKRKSSEPGKVTTKCRLFTESQRKLPEVQEIGVHDRRSTVQVQTESQSNMTDESRCTTEKRMNDYEASSHFIEGDDCMQGADNMVTDKLGDENKPNGRKIAYVLPLAKEDNSEAPCMQNRQNSPSIHERNSRLENEPILSEMSLQRMEENEDEDSVAPSSPSIGSTMHNAECTPDKSPLCPMETLWSSFDEDGSEGFSAPASSSSDRTLPYACGKPVKLFQSSYRRQKTLCKKQLTREWIASLPDSGNQLPPAAASVDLVGTPTSPRAVGVEKMGSYDVRFVGDGYQTWYIMSDVEAAYCMEVRFLRRFGRVQARTCSDSEAAILNSSLSSVLFKKCKGGESQLMIKDSVDFVKKVKRAVALLKPLKGFWPLQFSFPDSVEQFFDIVSSLREDMRGPATSIHLPQDVVLGLRQLLVDNNQVNSQQGDRP